MIETANFNNHFQYDVNYEMSYTSLMTPPMSGSEGSRSPQMSTVTAQIVPQYDIQNFIMQYEADTPYLEIVEQPVDKFRFRYKSEMSGTHGSLCGKSNERNRKQTFPTVQLKNFIGPATIRCSLYQYNTHTSWESWEPHAHRLVRKSGEREVDDPHDKFVEHPQDQKIVFNNMGIIHTAKKYLAEEICKKKEKLMKEEIKRKEGVIRELKTSELSELQREANEKSKSINLNIVCLRFDAFEDRNGILHQICPPVFSNAIHNLKSALTGELKITRMSRSSCPACGNKEIFLLVEKVTKKNINVRFFELDEDDNEIWSADGKFYLNDVHHQYAIVAMIPAYRDVNIDSEVKVYIELERPTDGAKSAPLDFTYYPDRLSRRKRPRMYDSSTSFSSGEMLPSVLPELNPFLNSRELEVAAQGVDSDDFTEFKQLLDIDTLETRNNSAASSKTREEGKKVLLKVFSELDSFFKTNPNSNKTIKMLEKCMQECVDRNLNNVLHICYMNFSMVNVEKLNNILQLLIKLNLTHLLNAKNKDDNTLMHIAIENNCMYNFGELINVMDLTIKNCDGLTPLHLAIEKDYKYESILKSRNVQKFIDITSDSDYTALQIAVMNDKLAAVQSLCKAGANVNLIDRKSGDNLLHTCVHRMTPSSLKIAKFLIEETDIDVSKKNFAEISCLAAARTSGEELAKAMCKLIEDKLKSLGVYEEERSFIKDEPESDDDEDRMEIDLDVKQENLSEEEIRHLYGQVIQFTPDCLEQVSKMLNVDNKWKALPPMLDLQFILASDMFDGIKNPALSFINFALANGVSVYQIRMNLIQLNEYDVVKLIDDMALNSE